MLLFHELYCTVSIFALLFFFVKQKTAYEMRISDWSSDVCSSDLAARELVREAVGVLDGQADDGQQLLDPRLDLGVVPAEVDLQRLGQRGPDGHAGVERRVRVLEDDLEAAAGLGQLAAAPLGERLAVEQPLARGGLDGVGEQAPGRGRSGGAVGK